MNQVRYEIFRLYGIVTDIEPVELMNGRPVPGVPTPAVWTGGQNVVFDDGASKRVDGYLSFAKPLPAGADPIFSLNVITPTVSWWLWVDAQTPASPKIYATDGAAHYDITPTAGLTGGDVGQWSGCILNGVPALNNQVDYPIWWNLESGTPMEVLPDWPENNYCKVIRSIKYSFMVGGITRDSVEIPELYMWSSQADPGTIPQEWAPTPENSAGETPLADATGGIVDMAVLRDDMFIYTKHSTYRIQYVGGQFVFRAFKLFYNLGAQALNCVVEMKGKAYVFADDDVVVHDGNAQQSIIDRKVRRLLFKSIDQDNQTQCHTAVRAPRDEIWFCVPRVGGTRCTRAIVYSFNEDQFGVRDLPNIGYVASGIVPDPGIPPSWENAPFTWHDDPRFWNEALYSPSNDGLVMAGNSNLYHVDAAQDADGEEVPAMLERLHWTIYGEEHIWQNDLIMSIYPVLTGTEGDVIKVQVAASRSAAAPIDWKPAKEMIVGGSNKVDIFAHGRYLNMRFTSTGGNPWQLHRIGIEFVPSSKY